MPEARIIVAGGRDFDDYDLMNRQLTRIMNGAPSEISSIEIVCGMQEGADLLGKRWAEEHGYKVAEFEADWDKFGKKAGPIRNAQMAKYANALIAFWDGKSRGTADMIEKMKNEALIIIHYETVQKKNNTTGGWETVPR